jgi:hypothetical protein
MPQSVDKLLHKRVAPLTGCAVRSLAVDRMVFDHELLATDGNLDGAVLGHEFLANGDLTCLDRSGSRPELFLYQLYSGAFLHASPLRRRSARGFPGTTESMCTVCPQHAFEFANTLRVCSNVDDQRAV